MNNAHQTPQLPQVAYVSFRRSASAIPALDARQAAINYYFSTIKRSIWKIWYVPIEYRTEFLLYLVRNNHQQIVYDIARLSPAANELIRGLIRNIILTHDLNLDEHNTLNRILLNLIGIPPSIIITVGR